MNRVFRLCGSLLSNNPKIAVPYGRQLSSAQHYLLYGNRRNSTAPPPPPSSSSKGSTNTECWNCKKVTDRKNHMLCADCGRIQDVNPEINYFDLLNFPKFFGVEPTELAKRFRQLQTLVHPDKYSTKSEREQFNSAEWSSLINKAYKTLSAPVERGQYMLCLNGEQIPVDNSSLNKEFLMEMMERNEQVDEADSAVELHKLNDRIVAELKLKIEQLNAEFADNALDRAKAILIEMKYLLSLQNSIKKRLDDLNLQV